ncbi:hypothetical protein PVAP13_6KG249600 [Panicum virgatum]|uniref:Uncharacterized protein n=1 Tax=Panicum virgatum TaxID=38727 RepID=A0A8T0RGF7_PANVG|nr:hypothetical protein PVAP13_6KG249600 [Panicum virgatum]
MAAAARTPSGRRLVSLAVLAAFLLGALWLASALHVSRSLERFLAVECSVWGHEESCFVAIRWAGTAGFVALASAVALSYGEAARRREQAGGAKGEDEGPPGREPERDRASAVTIHAIALYQIYLMPAVLFIVGKALSYAGARLLRISRPQAMPEKHFSTFILLCCWELWKRRNNVVFRGERATIQETLRASRADVELWKHRLRQEDRWVVAAWCARLHNG